MQHARTKKAPGIKTAHRVKITGKTPRIILLRVAFDPKTRELKGTVNIDYTNKSPDTLNHLLFKLFPNLYQKEAMRTMPVAPDDLGDGVHISKLAIDNKVWENNQPGYQGDKLNGT